jgi:uncharacterized membrane protein
MSIETLKHYGISVIIFLAIDAVWLLLIAKNLYSKYLGYLMAKSPNLIAALIFYLIFVAGMLYFVINPALVTGRWQDALISGMFFGFVTYATYDLTNLATIKDWPIIITLIDLAWGSFVTAATCVISFFVIKSF